jgi:hypothetical protein
LALFVDTQQRELLAFIELPVIEQPKHRLRHRSPITLTPIHQGALPGFLAQVATT